MQNKHVMLICGGVSGEHDISLQSARNVWQGLARVYHRCSVVYLSPQREWFYVRDCEQFFAAPHAVAFTDNDRLDWRLGPQSQAHVGEMVLTPDVIFPIVHGTLGEDGALQGFFELAHIPYVGADVLGAAVNMHKHVCKTLWQAEGLPVVPWRLVRRGLSVPTYQESAKQLGANLFVKVANQGSSIGVYSVNDVQAYDHALEDAFKYGDSVLIEQSIIGREIEVAVMLDETPFASLPGEIETQANAYYDFEAKYMSAGAAVLHTPANLTDEQQSGAQALALKAAKASFCKSYARVDLFLCADGRFYINEINCIPGFTAISLYPKLMSLSGFTLESLLGKLIDQALARHLVPLCE